MKTLAFFNPKSKVGKSTLVYHIAWMLSDLGKTVLVVDLDPQTNLTKMFLREDQLEEIWPYNKLHKSIFSSITPILETTGNIEPPQLHKINHNIHLIPGDLGLMQLEDKLSDCWLQSLDNNQTAFNAICAFYHIIYHAAKETDSEFALIDSGPNLGTINRSALIASDYVLMPLAPNFDSLQSLEYFGRSLKKWHQGWKHRIAQKKLTNYLPADRMTPLGYIIMQHDEGKYRPENVYQQWSEKIPDTYKKYILCNKGSIEFEDISSHCIGQVRCYHFLMPMAKEAKKPIFYLKPADGAIGSHSQSVWKCYLDFKKHTETILKKISKE